MFGEAAKASARRRPVPDDAGAEAHTVSGSSPSDSAPARRPPSAAGSDALSEHGDTVGERNHEASFKGNFALSWHAPRAGVAPAPAPPHGIPAHAAGLCVLHSRSPRPRSRALLTLSAAGSAATSLAVKKLQRRVREQVTLRLRAPARKPLRTHGLRLTMSVMALVGTCGVLACLITGQVV